MPGDLARDRSDRSSSCDPTICNDALPGFALAAAATIAGLSALVFGRDATWHGLHQLAQSDSTIVIVLMLGLATFVAGSLIAPGLRPLADAVDNAIQQEAADDRDPGRPVSERQDALVGAGQVIGWLERLIVFFAILLGRPEAIVLVLTAKSFARFPSLKNEAFGEYFLIGTLLSLVAAVAVAIATRVILGQAAL